MKTILFHVQDDDGLDYGFDSAQSIARACGGHLHCLHAVPNSAFITGGGMADADSAETVADFLSGRAETLRARIENDLANEDLSWDYRHVIGDVATAFIQEASLCDLIVSNRNAPRGRSDESPLRRLGLVLEGAGTPVFIPGRNGKLIDPNGPAVIAWDGSHEASIAVRQSIGLLKLASETLVLRVNRRKDAFPDTRLLEYLSRYGIKAELTVEDADERDVGPLLIDFAERAGNAYIVMGAYSHSRVGEYLFGGLTRRMLKDCPVGILLSH
ncbi:MAG: universal stress protein [Sphingomicrobium sp.]